MAFQAKYPGWCPNCDDRIAEGDEVRHSGAGELMHNLCVDDSEVRDVTACATCHLIHAGECF